MESTSTELQSFTDTEISFLQPDISSRKTERNYVRHSATPDKLNVAGQLLLIR